MNTSLVNKIKTFESLSGYRVQAYAEAHDEYGWFEDWLKDCKEEFTLDELAPIAELDYMDFEDYIEYMNDELGRYPSCTCSIGCNNCLGLTWKDFY